MSQHDPLISLKHMLDHAAEAIALVTGKHRMELDTNRMLCLALSRLLEIVGEAAGRMPEEIMRSNPRFRYPLANRLQ